MDDPMDFDGAAPPIVNDQATRPSRRRRAYDVVECSWRAGQAPSSVTVSGFFVCCVETADGIAGTSS
jgi:hypothetical protein